MNEEKDIEVLNFANCITGQCFQKTGLPEESIITEQQKQLMDDAVKGSEELGKLLKTSFQVFDKQYANYQMDNLLKKHNIPMYDTVFKEIEEVINDNSVNGAMLMPISFIRMLFKEYKNNQTAIENMHLREIIQKMHLRESLYQSTLQKTKNELSKFSMKIDNFAKGLTTTPHSNDENYGIKYYSSNINSNSPKEQKEGDEPCQQV